MKDGETLKRPHAPHNTPQGVLKKIVIIPMYISYRNSEKTLTRREKVKETHAIFHSHATRESCEKYLSWDLKYWTLIGQSDRSRDHIHDGLDQSAFSIFCLPNKTEGTRKYRAHFVFGHRRRNMVDHGRVVKCRTTKKIKIQFCRRQTMQTGGFGHTSGFGHMCNYQKNKNEKGRRQASTYGCWGQLLK